MRSLISSMTSYSVMGFAMVGKFLSSNIFVFMKKRLDTCFREARDPEIRLNFVINSICRLCSELLV